MGHVVVVYMRVDSGGMWFVCDGGGVGALSPILDKAREVANGTGTVIL